MTTSRTLRGGRASGVRCRSATASGRCGSCTRAPATKECAFVNGSVPDGVRIAWDFRHETWTRVDGAVRVGDAAAEPFRYLRLQEPPYAEDDLREVAATLRAPAYVYVRHEDEPTAPATAARLRLLLDQE